MDIHTPCSACFSINHKPALARQSLSSRNIRFKTKSQLQTPVSVNGGVQSPSIQTHKVTVHDRQAASVELSMNFSYPRLLYKLCRTCKVWATQTAKPEALGNADICWRGMHFFVWASHHLTWRLRHKMRMDEVYWLQFGRYFARGPIDRDDYALELAMGDE